MSQHMASWNEVLFLFLILCFIGLSGIIFNYKNFLVTMLCMEMMYLGITICFSITGVSTSDPKGQMYALILLIITAADSAVGLGILVVLYKYSKSIAFSEFEELRG